MKSGIYSFTGDYFFLSNFYTYPISVFGLTFKNNEAAFQSQKCLARASEFQELWPSKAKKLGRSVELRPDWEDIKDEIMYQVLCAKFKDHFEMSYVLLRTGDRELVEGNYWGDTYWGVCKGNGQNKLGKLLMQIREELKQAL